MSGHRLRVGFVAFLLVVAACSGTPTATDPEFPPWLETMVASTTDFQKEILLDGEVTVDELEKAILANVQCQTENGVEIRDFVFDPFGGGYEMSIVWGEDRPDDSDLESLDAIEEMCTIEYSIAVEGMFMFQNQSTPEELSAELARTAQCLREKGFEVPEGAAQQQLQGIAASERRIYGECRQLAQDQSN
ncbi:MAG TPA: hypothetical protein ENG98_04670 [Actinobacteria bacterium]|nr:hypothetical protein [Actinomycetota bacterium]